VRLRIHIVNLCKFLRCLVTAAADERDMERPCLEADASRYVGFAVPVASQQRTASLSTKIGTVQSRYKSLSIRERGTLRTAPSGKCWR